MLKLLLSTTTVVLAGNNHAKGLAAGSVDSPLRLPFAPAPKNKASVSESVYQSLIYDLNPDSRLVPRLPGRPDPEVPDARASGFILPIPAKSGFPISRIRDSGQIGISPIPRNPGRIGIRGKIPNTFPIPAQ